MVHEERDGAAGRPPHPGTDAGRVSHPPSPAAAARGDRGREYSVESSFYERPPSWSNGDNDESRRSLGDLLSPAALGTAPIGWGEEGDGQNVLDGHRCGGGGTDGQRAGAVQAPPASTRAMGPGGSASAAAPGLASSQQEEQMEDDENTAKDDKPP